MIYEYRVSGLDCANCAAILARAISKMKGITLAEIDFMQGKLTVNAEEITPQAFEKMQQLAASFEGATLSLWESETAAALSETAAALSETACADISRAEGCCGVHHEPSHEDGHGNGGNAHAHGGSPAHAHGGNPAHSHSHAEGFSLKREILCISISAVLLILAAALPVHPYVKLGLYALSYLTVGGKVLISSAKNIARGRVFDEQFLMSIATLGAFALQEYAEGVFVMLFYSVGEVFQKIAVERSRKSVLNLLSLKVPFCRVLRGGEEVSVPPESVAVGETVILNPGEKLALDGTVLSGATDMDLSSLSGESKPVSVCEGDRVYGGALNLSGSISVQVTKPYKKGALGKILALLENASSKKAKTERFITRFSAIYTPVVVGIAAVVGVVIPLFLGDFPLWISRALTCLVISCPCALVLSVPLTFFAGIGGLAKRGVLVKGGNYIEALSKADVLFTDKTGTLTDGNLKVLSLLPAAGVTEEELLSLAALAEARSNHPLAKAVLAAYGKKELPAAVEELPGYGVLAETEKGRVLCGNARLLTRFQVDFPPVGSETYMLVAKEGVYAGKILFADSVKPEAKEAISGLRRAGIRRAYMLTGDGETSAIRVAEAVGLNGAHHGLLPEEKVALLQAESNGNGTLYLGEGLNDAPVLAAASVGVAMGALGSDIAVETADVVIADDNLNKAVTAKRRAKKTVRIVWQNVGGSLLVKAGVLALALCGIAPMWAAVFADVGVMVLAVLNSLRAY